MEDEISIKSNTLLFHPVNMAFSWAFKKKRPYFTQAFKVHKQSFKHKRRRQFSWEKHRFVHTWISGSDVQL